MTIANDDVTHDGQSFIMIKDESGSHRLKVVLNWFGELNRQAPDVSVSCDFESLEGVFRATPRQVCVVSGPALRTSPED